MLFLGEARGLGEKPRRTSFYKLPLNRCSLNPRSPSIKNKKGLQDQKVNWSLKPLINFVAVSDTFSLKKNKKTKNKVKPLARFLPPKYR